MIVYLANKTQFRADILKERGRLAHESFQSALGKSAGASELAAWKNSLRHMDTVLEDAGIPDNAGVAKLNGKGAQASCLYLENEKATDPKATGRMPMLLSNLFVGSGAFSATPSKHFPVRSSTPS